VALSKGIADVEVEIRESIVTRFAGPKLLTPDLISDDAISALREQLTPTLGLPICAQHTPCIGGTGGLFLAEGGNNKKLLLLTARHVVYPPNKSHNNSQRDEAFKTYLKSIDEKKTEFTSSIEHQELRIRLMKTRDDPEVEIDVQIAEQVLEMTRKTLISLNGFYKDVSTRWDTPESRLLGHVVLSPPISVGAGSSSDGYRDAFPTCTRSEWG
jgi:hypothetical protein